MPCFLQDTGLKAGYFWGGVPLDFHDKSCLFERFYTNYLGKVNSFWQVVYFFKLGGWSQLPTRWWQLKYFLFSTLPEEMIQFDNYFSNGLKPPTSLVYFKELLFCSSTFEILWQLQEMLREFNTPLPRHSIYGICAYIYLLEIQEIVGTYTICWVFGLGFARNFQHYFEFSMFHLLLITFPQPRCND